METLVENNIWEFWRRKKYELCERYRYSYRFFAILTHVSEFPSTQTARHSTHAAVHRLRSPNEWIPNEAAISERKRKKKSNIEFLRRRRR